MLQVLGQVRGVDHQDEVVLAEAVQVGVVDGPAGLVGDQGVLGLPGGQGLGVVGEHVLQEGEAAGPVDAQAAHVADVPHAAVAAGGEVLAEDARLVLQGHVPAAEGDHLPAVGVVPGVERGLLEGLVTHGDSSARAACGSGPHGNRAAEEGARDRTAAGRARNQSSNPRASPPTYPRRAPVTNWDEARHGALACLRRAGDALQEVDRLVLDRPGEAGAGTVAHRFSPEVHNGPTLTVHLERFS